MLELNIWWNKSLNINKSVENPVKFDKIKIKLIKIAKITEKIFKFEKNCQKALNLQKYRN